MTGAAPGAVRGGLAVMRGAVVRAVQRRLAAVGPGHALRRLHVALRGNPLVSFLWRRLLGAGARDWFEIASYRRHGGRFAHAAVQPRARTGPQTPPEAAPILRATGPSWAFMDRLATDASTYEPTYQPVAGRVVLVNCSLAAGGAERQVAATLKGLRERGHEPVFIGEFIEGGDRSLDFHLPALRAAGIAVERADPGPLPGPEFYAGVTEPVAGALSLFEPEPVTRLLGMVRHLRRLRPEVVHLWQDQTSVLHGLAALIARVPRIVLSGRNVEPTHFGYFQPWLEPGYRVLAAQAHVTLTNNSQAGARAYARWLGLDPARIGVIVNAVQLPPPMDGAGRAAARARLAVSEAALLVAGVMRMSDEKQPLLWIQTAATLALLQPDARFVVAGDGPLMSEVRARAQALGLGDRIAFLGEIEDVRTLQAACDVLLLTSAREGTPNVLLEAQALDTPVVTTDAGGSAACVLPGRTGIVVPLASATPDRLAQAVLEAAALGPDLRRAGTGRAYVAEAFAQDRMIEATLRAYGIGSGRPRQDAPEATGGQAAVTGVDSSCQAMLVSTGKRGQRHGT